MFKDSNVKAILGMTGLIVVVMFAVFHFTKVETVTPAVPPHLVAAPECGVEPTVTIPEEKGIEYTSVRSEDVVVVTAQPESRKYEIKGDFQWVFDVAAEKCATSPMNSSSGTQNDPYNYADELIEETKRLGEEATNLGKDATKWADENGVLDKFAELGTGAKESVEDWAQSGQ